jgi:hypothetical protein
MKTKILMGSLFVLTLLLLVPSIPAIQQITIKDKISEYKRLIKSNPWEPNLTLLSFILFLRIMRGGDLIHETSNWWYKGDEKLEIYNPILFIYGWWVLLTAIGFCLTLDKIVEIMGWDDWQPPLP